MAKTEEAVPAFSLTEIKPSSYIERDDPVPGKTTIYYDRGAGAVLRKLTIPSGLFTKALEEFAHVGEPAANP